MSGLTTKPGSRPASAFIVGDPFKPGSQDYELRHAARSFEMLPGLTRVDIGGPTTEPATTTSTPEGTLTDA